MTLKEAILARHSVRCYRKKPLAVGIVKVLEEKIAELNRIGNLHIQLITNEPRAFSGMMARYGRFRGVNDYIVIAGKKSDDLDERAGYFGEQLVLYAQTLGLNTCWVGLNYSKIAGTYVLAEDEKIVCYIAIGYGVTQGGAHKTKSVSEVSNVSSETPAWFREGVEAALLAPTAINQQKFSFTYEGLRDGVYKVQAKRGHSLIGYTHIDLGIAKFHFEVGAGRQNFEWL